MKNKSCELNQIDTSTLKDILIVCFPAITQIVDMSLTKRDFIEDWKTAIVRPLLEKPGLELVHKNHRTVSNLFFLSRLVG